MCNILVFCYNNATVEETQQWSAAIVTSWLVLLPWLPADLVCCHGYQLAWTAGMVTGWLGPPLQAQAMEILWEKHQLRGLQEDIASLIDCAHKTKSVGPSFVVYKNVQS